MAMRGLQLLLYEMRMAMDPCRLEAFYTPPQSTPSSCRVGLLNEFSCQTDLTKFEGAPPTKARPAAKSSNVSIWTGSSTSAPWSTSHARHSWQGPDE